MSEHTPAALQVTGRRAGLILVYPVGILIGFGRGLAKGLANAWGMLIAEVAGMHRAWWIHWMRSASRPTTAAERAGSLRQKR